MNLGLKHSIKLHVDATFEINICGCQNARYTWINKNMINTMPYNVVTTRAAAAAARFNLDFDILIKSFENHLLFGKSTTNLNVN